MHHFMDEGKQSRSQWSIERFSAKVNFTVAFSVLDERQRQAGIMTIRAGSGLDSNYRP